MRQLREDRALFWVSAISFLFWLLVAGVVNAQEGTASWYSTECCHYNQDPRCPTASGQSLYNLEQQGVLFAAMWSVPLGSSVRVCRVDREAVCTTAIVLDRGPARRLGRIIDLSREAFAQLADPREGVIRVTVERL